MPLIGLPNGREHGENRLTGTHRIKIGLTTTMQGKTGSYVGPTTTNGFFIIRNTVASIKAAKSRVSSHVIDYDAMSSLGFSREQVDRAIAEHREAPPGLLPHAIDFILLCDAVRDETTGNWKFPGMFDGEYSAFNVKGPGDSKNPDVLEDPEWAKHGLRSMSGCYCRGDGETAKRRSPGGFTRTIACNPRGKLGVPEEKYCPVHVRGLCKAGTDLVVMLIKPRVNPNDPIEPLVPVHNARFLLETTSVDNYLAFETELATAAQALDGNLSHLTGTLEFRLQNVIKPTDPFKSSSRGGDQGGSSGVAPKISIRLNQWQITERARELGIRPVFAAPSAKQLTGPTTVDVIDIVHAPAKSAAAESNPQVAPIAYPEAHAKIPHETLLQAIGFYVTSIAEAEDLQFDVAWNSTAWVIGKSGRRAVAGVGELSGKTGDWALDMRDKFIHLVADRLAVEDPDVWASVLESALEAPKEEKPAAAPEPEATPDEAPTQETGPAANTSAPVGDRLAEEAPAPATTHGWED